MTEIVEMIVLVIDPATGSGTVVAMTVSWPLIVVVIVVIVWTASVAGTTE